jgi:hypothetical protein
MAPALSADENVDMTLQAEDPSPPGGDPAGDLYVCTWLHADSADEPSVHYQLRGDSSSARFQATFWRCVALFFVTSVRQQPEARHVLFTNVASLPTVDDVPMEALLDSLGVEIVRLPLTFRTPPGYYHEWRSQFYVFDILQYLAARLGPSDSAILLDSDCVWVSHVGPMWQALRRDGVLTYAVTYAPEWRVNGLTRADMTAIASALLGQEIRHPLVYCGGEFVAATAAEIRRLASETAAVWKQLMERYGLNEAVFSEEAHTLSYVYYKLGYPLGNGDPFIRRIWTDSLRPPNNATRHDYGLVVWHVPGEKRLGIRRLFSSVAQRTSPLWTLGLDGELQRYLGAALGIPRSSTGKRVRDLHRRVLERIAGRNSRA